MDAPTNDVDRHLIDLEGRALDRWCRGDPSGFLELSAKDVVYFDPFVEHRIDGRSALEQYYEALRGKIQAERFEIVDPVVQAGGGMAVLTFHFRAERAGAEACRWNCTEVYRHDPEGWRIVQSHWSLTTPPR